MATLIQSTSGGSTSTGVSGNSTSFGSNVTAGNTVIIVVGYQGNVAVSAVTDNQGNQYHLASRLQDASGTRSCAIWYATNISSGSLTVRATFATFGNQPNVLLREYSGVGNVDSNVVTLPTPNSSPLSLAAPLTAYANDLVIGVMQTTSSSGLTFTPGTGYGNLVTVQAGVSNLYTVVEDQIVSATGSYTSSFTVTGGTVTCSIFCIAFSPFANPSLPQNYQQMKVGDGMSVSEKIR